LLRHRQLLAQKSHGTVQMMQLQRLGPWNPITSSPLLRRSVTPGDKQPMQDGQINGSLHIEGVPSFSQQTLQLGLDPLSFPQPSEDEIRANPKRGDPRSRIFFDRIDHRQLFAEAQTRAHQRVQLAAGLQQVQPPHGCQRPLAYFAAFPVVLHNLQIAIRSRWLLAKKHSAPPILTLRIKK